MLLFFLNQRIIEHSKLEGAHKGHQVLCFLFCSQKKATRNKSKSKRKIRLKLPLPFIVLERRELAQFNQIKEEVALPAGHNVFGKVVKGPDAAASVL